MAKRTLCTKDDYEVASRMSKIVTSQILLSSPAQISFNLTMEQITKINT